MKKILRILFISLVVLFIVIQFFSPKKNSGTTTSDHIFEREQMPESVKVTLKNACMDCHSNQTNYVWYNKIAPVSWMISNHINEGKEELNFSTWGQMNTFDKITALEDICREVERKKMPIKSYTFMHKDAKLSEEQVLALCAWSEELSENLLVSE